MTIWRMPVNLQWNGVGSPGANVWHFRTEAEIFDRAEFDAATAAIEQFYAGLGQWAFFQPGMSIDAEAAVDVETQEMRSVDWTPIQIGGSEAEAPEVLQVCVTWRTDIAARRGRGRTFLGPLNSGVMQSNGSISEQHIVYVQNAADALVDASTAANGWAVGVYGLQSSGGGPTAPRVLRDITSARIRDRFAVLRSRRD